MQAGVYRGFRARVFWRARALHSCCQTLSLPAASSRWRERARAAFVLSKTRTASKKEKGKTTVTMVLDDPNTTGNKKEVKRKGSLSDTQQTSKREKGETKHNLKLKSNKGKQNDASTDEDTTF
jgi:hypothetical protein